MDKLDAGTHFLNDLLGGGYESEIVTTIYGPSGSGKTLLLMQTMMQTPKDGKVIYVDTEGGFSTERFAQVCPYHERVLERTTFLNPTTFEEQEDVVEKIHDLLNAKMSLLAFDTFTALYRVKMSSENNYELNKTLAKQLRSLVEIARKKEIPVLCTAQMYQDFDDPEQYNVVGGQIVQNMSKCLLEMRKEDDDLRRLIIKKHRSQPSGKEVAFRIVEDGLEEASYEPRDV